MCSSPLTEANQKQVSVFPASLYELWIPFTPKILSLAPVALQVKTLPIAQSHNFLSTENRPLVSLMTVAALLLLSWFTTTYGWLPPLLLPAPNAVGSVVAYAASEYANQEKFVLNRLRNP